MRSPEPILIKAGSKRVMLGGLSPKVDCRVLAEEEYQRFINLEKENARLREFITGIAKHDFTLSDMCPHKVHEAAREILGWPIKEEDE